MSESSVSRKVLRVLLGLLLGATTVVVAPGAASAADTSPPNYPKNPVGSVDDAAGTVTLSWDAATDDVGVVDYEVFRNSVVVDTVTGLTSTVALGVGNHYMQVRARDAAGNAGGKTASVLLVRTAPDTTPPGYAQNPVGSVDDGAGTVTVSWGAASDNVGVVDYDVMRNSVVVDTVTGLTSTVALGPGTHYMQIRARDAAGNVGGNTASVVLVRLAPDTTPPGYPQNPVGSVDDAAGTVTVSWGAASDNVGVVDYDVMRNSVVVDTVTGLTSTVPLGPGTHYMQIRARDAAGNVGGNTASVVLVRLAPDTTPPGYPQNPVGSVDDAAGTVTVSWGAASDNVGVVDYDVMRNSVVVDTVTGLTSTVALGVGTHYMQIRARDAAGNVGGNTASVVLVRSAPPAGTPTAPDSLTTVPNVQLGTIDVSWSAATDDVAVTGYEVVLDGVVVNTTTSLTAVLTGVDIGAYDVQVRALDGDGNVSPFSATSAVELTWVLDTYQGTLGQPLANVLAASSSTTIRRSPSGQWTLVAGVDSSGVTVFWRSPDGLSWQKIKSSTTVGKAMIRDDGSILTYRRKRRGYIATHDYYVGRFDGTTWTERKLGPWVNEDWRGAFSVVADDDQLAIIGRSGNVWTSANEGVSWQSRGDIGGTGDTTSTFVAHDVAHFVNWVPYFGWSSVAVDPYHYRRSDLGTGASLDVTPPDAATAGPSFTEYGDITNRPWTDLIAEDPAVAGRTLRIKTGYGLGLNVFASNDDGLTWQTLVRNEPVPVRAAGFKPFVLPNGDVALFGTEDTGIGTDVVEVNFDLTTRTWSSPEITSLDGSTGTLSTLLNSDGDVEFLIAETGGNLWSAIRGGGVVQPHAPILETSSPNAVLRGLPTGSIDRHVSPNRSWQLIAANGVLWRSADESTWERIELIGDLGSRPPVAIDNDGRVVALGVKEFSVGFYDENAVTAWYFDDDGWTGSQRIDRFNNGNNRTPVAVFTDGDIIGAFTNLGEFFYLKNLADGAGPRWVSARSVADGPNGETWTEETSVAVSPARIDVVGDIAHIHGSTGEYSRWSISQGKLVAFEWQQQDVEDENGNVVETIDVPVTRSSTGAGTATTAAVDGSTSTLAFFTPGTDLLNVPSADAGATFGTAVAEAYPVPVPAQQVTTTVDTYRVTTTADCATSRLVYSIEHDAGPATGIAGPIPVYIDVTGTAQLVNSALGGSTPAIGHDVWVVVNDADGRALVRIDSDIASPEAVFGFDGYGITTNGVNVSAGTFTHAETDVAVPTAGPELGIRRTYNSADQRIGMFGRGWTSNYETRVFENCITGDATILHGDGRRETHPSDGAGGYVLPEGYPNRLAKTSNGWTLNETDGTVYSFRSDGRLTTVTNADGQQIALAWSGAGSNVQLDTVTDSASGRTLTVTHSAGKVVSVATNPVTAQGATASLVWTFGYDGHNLERVCDARNNDLATGNCRTYSTTDGAITQVNDANGHIDRRVDYDSGSVAWEEDGEGNRTTFDYGNRQTSVTDPRGNVTVTDFDELRRTTKVTDALGNEVNYTYDANGYLSTTTDPNGNPTTRVFDADGNALSESDGEGATTYFSYDQFNNVTEQRDARSTSANDDTYLVTSTWTGVTRNQLTRVLPPTTQHPAGVITSWTYSDGSETAIGGGTMPAGLLLSETDANGAATTFAYNAAGDLARSTDRTGLLVDYTLDELGRRITETQTSSTYPGGVVSTTEYDALNQVVRSVGPATTNAVTGGIHQLEVESVFDAATNLTSSTYSDIGGAADAPADRTTTYSYDDADRLITRVDPDSGIETREYDAAGNVVATVDAEGRRYEFAYDDRNLRTTTTGIALVTDEGAGAALDIDFGTTIYDPAGLIVGSTDALGRTTSIDYDDANRQTAVTRVGHVDRNGSTRDIVLQDTIYDPAGFATTITTGDGQRVEERTYDEAGRLISTRLDPAGLDRTSTSTYDANGNLTVTTVSDGVTTEETRYTYDASDRVTTETIENGVDDLITTYTYDQRSVLTSETDPRGNAPGAAPVDFTTTFLADELGRITTAQAPTVDSSDDGVQLVTGNPEAVSGFNAFADETHARDERASTTTRDYDQLGRLTTIEHPAYTRPSTGATITPTETFAYDAVGNLTSRTDRRGQTTTYTFDGLNRLSTQTDPGTAPSAGGITSWYYDDADNTIAQIDQRGARTEIDYDSLDRTRTVTDVIPQGPNPSLEYAWTYDYDDLGNQTLERSPAGDETTASYSPASEVLAITDAAGFATTFTYDVASRQTSIIDPLTRKIETDYDLAGRPVATTTLATNGIQLTETAIVFDAASNVIATTTPRGLVQGATAADHTTTFDYDAIGRLVTVDQPTTASNSITTTYRYDPSGNLSGVVDGRSNVTTYAYNAWNLQTELIEPATANTPNAADRTWATEYDAGGLPVRTAEPDDVVIDRIFDDLGRLTSETGDGPNTPQATRTFGYDRASYLTTVGTPNGNITATYDARGLLAQTAGAPEYASQFSYDSVGRMTSRTDTAGTTTFGWNNRNQLSSITEGLTSTEQTNTFDAAGQLSTITYNGGASARTMTYDDLGRISGDAHTAGAATIAGYGYTYDVDGNVTGQTVNHPGNPATGTHSFTYDNAGRITSWTDPAAQTSAYGWDNSGNLTDNASTTQAFDERNQLVSAGTTTYDWTNRGTLDTVTTNDGGLQVVEGYVFDALGRTTTSPSASYTYDSLDRVATADATAFGYGGLEIDPTSIGTSLIARTPAGVPVASKDGTNPALLLGRNRHGDVGYAHTTAGVVSSTTVYDPLGAIVGSTGTPMPIGFQGDYTDTSTGDVWMGARWYQPGTGTFASRDTVFGQLSTPMSVNRYTYAFGNPLGMWDPDGREPQCAGDFFYYEGGTAVCSNNLMDVVEAKTQRSNDISDQFVANMRDALVQTATQIADMALDLVPGGDCIRGAVNVAQGDSVGLGNGVGCALDIVPVVGNAASTVFRYGDDAIEAVHDVGRAADRAGDTKALDTPSWGQVDGPSINRVTPEPPAVRAPEPKQLDVAHAERPREVGPAGNPAANPNKGTWEANIGGTVESFVTEADDVFWRVSSSGQFHAGGFLTKVKPRSSSFAREASALPPWNRAELVQPVSVPAGTRLNRSRALPAFGHRGGAEQFELLEDLSIFDFGPRVPLGP